MIRFSWPTLLLFVGVVVVAARNPRLLFSRAFFPILLVLGIIVFVTYVKRPRPPGGRR